MYSSNACGSDVDAERTALTHCRGGLRVVSGDVTDDHRGGVRAEIDDVVPVAAHLGALGPGQIPHGVPRTTQRRQHARQQRPLQVFGDGDLGLEQQRPLQRLRGEPTERHQGRLLVGVELPQPAVADDHDTDRLPGADQRQKRPRLPAATR
jgi:hypothetical protein